MTGKTYETACDCGAITCEFTTAIAPEDWHVRTCTCDFCSGRPGHVHWSDPHGTVRFTFAAPDTVTRTQHGTRTADFIICGSCDGYMGAVMASDAGSFAVLNIGQLAEELPLPERYPIKFRGEDLETRLVRRHKNWTPVIGDA